MAISKKKKQIKEPRYRRSATKTEVVEVLVTPGSALVIPVPLSVRINVEEKKL